MSTIDDVMAGRSRWCVMKAENADVLPTISEVDHCLTDPPYEAEAHTLQRRVKNGERTSKWGGGGQSTPRTQPSRSHPSPTASGGGWRVKSPESRSDGSPPSVRSRPP